MNRKMNHEKNFEMREIKFRGKRVDKEEFAFGDLLTGMGYKKGRFFILPHLSYYPSDCHSVDGYEVKPETIGQYTGLKDKNGKEIYEGDILKHSYWDRAPLDVYQQGGKDEYIEEILIVKYRVESGRYLSDLFTDIDMWICEDSEVIGNIYDNPELVEQ